MIHSDFGPQHARMYSVGALGRWWTWQGSVRGGMTSTAKKQEPLLHQASTKDAFHAAQAALEQCKNQANQRKTELRARIRQLEEMQRLRATRCQQLDREHASIRKRLDQLQMVPTTGDSSTLPKQMKTWEQQAAERTKAHLERCAHLVQRISSAKNRSAELQHDVSTLQARVDAIRSQVYMHARLSTPPPELPPLEPDTDSLSHLLPKNLLSCDDSLDTPSSSFDSPHSPPTPSGSTVFTGPRLPPLNPRAKEFTSSRSSRTDSGYSKSLVSPMPFYHLI